MKTKTMAALACIAIALLLGACALPTAGSGLASLRVSAVGAGAGGAKTVFSLGAGGACSYRAILSSGGIEVARASDPSTILSFADLEPGTYQLDVVAFARDGNTVIATGSETLTLKAGTNAQKTVNLSWVTTGDGIFSYSITLGDTANLPPGLVFTCEYSYALVGQPLADTGSFALDPQTYTGGISDLSLPCGDYRFRFVFRDTTDLLLLSFSECVQVLAHLPTTGSKTLGPSDFASAPKTPASITASRAYPGVRIDWSAGVGPDTVDFYYVEHKGPSDPDWSNAFRVPGTYQKSFVDEFAEAGINYQYRICAKNRYGSSGYAYSESITLPALTVSYAGNGAASGAAPVDPTLYRPGDTVTVLGNVGSPALAKDYYGFGGWSLGGLSYGADDTFVLGDDSVTLSAVWNLIPPTVTSSLSADCNEHGTASGTLTANQPVTWSWDNTKTANEYGNFTLNPSTGAWTYAPDLGIQKVRSSNSSFYGTISYGWLEGDTVHPTPLQDFAISIRATNPAGGVTSPQTLTITILGQNDAPVCTNSEELQAIADVYTTCTVTGTDDDTPQAALYYYISEFPVENSAWLYQFTDDFDNLVQITPDDPRVTDYMGRFFLRPAPNTGDETIVVAVQVAVHDGLLTSSPRTLSFAIPSVNDPPIGE